MHSFDRVAETYESGRPAYPDRIFEALEPLAGALVLEGGAGTGIASRALIERGARLVAYDVGRAILLRARAASPGLRAVVADGGAMPFRDGQADLVCFAQAWHWIDERHRCEEAARVLRAGGRWAGWWSHARADGESWFDSSWDRVESACPGTDRGQRDIDWADGLRRSGLFAVDDRVTVRWTRHVSVEQWMLDENSKSYVAALSPEEHRQLVGALDDLVRARFPDGRMSVPYETWLWTAHKI
ncbi:MAG: Methyltransferase type 11 [Actinomycetia bacterium]|nr:Methyltransferase type 11 [Actinomycetes bacterium]